MRYVAGRAHCATDEMRGGDAPRHGEEYAPYGLGLEPVDGLLIIHGGGEIFPTRHLAAIT